MKTTTTKRRSPSPNPTRASLRELPEVELSDYRVRRNRFARLIARGGIELAHEGPSAASLSEIPEVDAGSARSRRNVYAARIAKAGGIKLQVGRGRPARDEEVGVTVTRSVRLPPASWKEIERLARTEGITAHAFVRRAIVERVQRRGAR